MSEMIFWMVIGNIHASFTHLADLRPFWPHLLNYSWGCIRTKRDAYWPALSITCMYNHQLPSSHLQSIHPILVLNTWLYENEWSHVGLIEHASLNLHGLLNASFCGFKRIVQATTTTKIPLIIVCSPFFSFPQILFWVPQMKENLYIFHSLCVVLSYLSFCPRHCTVFL